VGEDTNKCFCSIPQEKWGQYFSDRIYWFYPTANVLFFTHKIPPNWTILFVKIIHTPIL
jgi:hypothetical protein